MLVVDDAPVFWSAVGDRLSRLGISVSIVTSFDDARDRLMATDCACVISELHVGGVAVEQFVDTAMGQVSPDRFVIVTAYPSIAAAVHFTRLGMAGFFAKPVSVADLIGVLNTCPQQDQSDWMEDEAIAWPSLDRTIWEYLSQVRVSAGSLSEAARRLGLHRGSLRRMLAKFPPAH